MCSERSVQEYSIYHQNVYYILYSKDIEKIVLGCQNMRWEHDARRNSQCRYNFLSLWIFWSAIVSVGHTLVCLKLLLSVILISSTDRPKDGEKAIVIYNNTYKMFRNK